MRIFCGYGQNVRLITCSLGKSAFPRFAVSDNTSTSFLRNDLRQKKPWKPQYCSPIEQTLRIVSLSRWTPRPTPFARMAEIGIFHQHVFDVVLSFVLNQTNGTFRPTPRALKRVESRGPGCTRFPKRPHVEVVSRTDV